MVSRNPVSGLASGMPLLKSDSAACDCLGQRLPPPTSYILHSKCQDMPSHNESHPRCRHTPIQWDLTWKLLPGDSMKIAESVTVLSQPHRCTMLASQDGTLASSLICSSLLEANFFASSPHLLAYLFKIIQISEEMPLMDTLHESLATFSLSKLCQCNCRNCGQAAECSEVSMAPGPSRSRPTTCSDIHEIHGKVGMRNDRNECLRYLRYLRPPD